MGRVISLINQKGGVGKTTTTVNLAASLAIANRKVLVLDFDPQGNASSALGFDRSKIDGYKTTYRALVGDVPLEQVVLSTGIDHLFLAPANSDLAGAEIELVSAIAREARLKNIIATVRHKYDYILIDCPPSLGLLTVNALTASDSFLVPMQCEYFALEGLSQLMQTVQLIRMSTNPNLQEEGLLLTMYDSKTNLSQQVSNEVRQHFGDLVYQTVIPRNIKLSECSSFGKPILLYDVHSKGNVAYVALAQEFLARNETRMQKESGLTTNQNFTVIPPQPNENRGII